MRVGGRAATGRYSTALRDDSQRVLVIHHGAPPAVLGPLGAADGTAALRDRAVELDAVDGTPLVLDPADELLFVCATGARTVPVQTCQWLVDAYRLLQSAEAPTRRRCSSGRAGFISSRTCARPCTTWRRSPTPRNSRDSCRRSTQSPCSGEIVSPSPSPEWVGADSQAPPRCWQTTCRPRPTTRRFARRPVCPAICRSAGEPRASRACRSVALRKTLRLGSPQAGTSASDRNRSASS